MLGGSQAGGQREARLECVLGLVHGRSSGAGEHHPCSPQPSKSRGFGVGTGLAGWLGAKSLTPLLRTAGYSERGPGMGCPSLTPLCIPPHPPACSPHHGPTDIPLAPTQRCRGSHTVPGTRLEATAGTRFSMVGRIFSAIPTYAQCRGVSQSMRVFPALWGLSGERMGLGSLPHWQDPLYVCVLGLME